jgi:hypothetical protein
MIPSLSILCLLPAGKGALSTEMFSLFNSSAPNQLNYTSERAVYWATAMVRQRTKEWCKSSMALTHATPPYPSISLFSQAAVDEPRDLGYQLVNKLYHSGQNLTDSAKQAMLVALTGGAHTTQQCTTALAVANAAGLGEMDTPPLTNPHPTGPPTTPLGNILTHSRTCRDAAWDVYTSQSKEKWAKNGAKATPLILHGFSGLLSTAAQLASATAFLSDPVKKGWANAGDVTEALTTIKVNRDIITTNTAP